MRTHSLVALLISLAPTAFAQSPSLVDGFYVGGAVSYADGETLDVNNPAADEKSLSDARIGVQVGKNWGIGNGMFLGLEGDLKFGALGSRWEGRSTNQYNSYYTEDEVNHSLALKAKVGYAVDRWALYGTVGAVWAKTTNSLGCDRALAPDTLGCATQFEDSKKSDASGYLLGVGAEYSVSDRVSLKMEYSHIDLGKNSVVLTDPNYPGAPVNNREFETSYGEIAFGINYRF